MVSNYHNDFYWFYPWDEQIYQLLFGLIWLVCKIPHNIHKVVYCSPYHNISDIKKEKKKKYYYQVSYAKSPGFFVIIILCLIGCIEGNNIVKLNKKKEEYRRFQLGEFLDSYKSSVWQRRYIRFPHGVYS